MTTMLYSASLLRVGLNRQYVLIETYFSDYTHYTTAKHMLEANDAASNCSDFCFSMVVSVGDLTICYETAN